MTDHVAPGYRRAGVDLELADEVVRRLKPIAALTRTDGVKSALGGFGGFFAFPDPGGERLLVASIDGVGTKVKIARLTGRWEAAGYDIVAHCVNDILVHGAQPLFFLDYLGVARLDVDIVAQLVSGMARACREAGCALLGGETAEMPSVYCEGEVDVVGCIVGTVGKQAVLPGDRVRDGDELIGLASWGLHTNGYSLARRVLVDFGPGIDGQLSGTGQRIGDALSANHRMYWAAARQFLERSELHAMAHITGGGIPGNLVRVLPAGMGARIDCGAWEVPAIFQEIQRHGGVDDEEMYRVFNMGIGWILVVAREVADEWRSKLTDEGWASVRLGRVERGVSGVQLARCVKG